MKHIKLDPEVESRIHQYYFLFLKKIFKTENPEVIRDMMKLEQFHADIIEEDGSKYLVITKSKKVIEQLPIHFFL